MADFHFLRPLWLLLILLVPLLYLIRHRLKASDIGWESHIPARLLRPLLPARQAPKRRASRSPLPPLCLALTVLAIALAGPSWREAPTPLTQSRDSLVIVLDLSISMLATDVEPDRVTQAQRKIRDILAERQSALNALIVYAGDAHVVTPLTEDRRTIEALLDALEPVIMPAQGNRADLAVEQAVKLLDQGSTGQGRILLLADQVSERYQRRINQTLSQTGYTLSTLAVGTEEGGPMPLARRGFIRDGGDIVITRAEPESLKRLAENNGGKSHRLTLGDADIRALALAPDTRGDWSETEDGLSVNRWQDDGYWLLWLALPLLFLGWRRGAFAIFALALLPMTLAPRQATALDWAGLWQREDQRAPELIEQDPQAASQQLQQPGWQGAALYRSGDFQAAAEAFNRQAGSQGHYNRGNALARAGELEQAIAAWEQALEENPEMENARYNKELVEQLLSQSEQDRSQSENGEDSQPGDSPPQPESGAQSGQAPAGGDSAPSQPPEASEPEEPEPSDGDSPAQPEQAPDTDSEPQATPMPEPSAESSLDQGQEQWLRRVPDNPGGLLQRKFLQQYQQRQTPTDEGDTPW